MCFTLLYARTQRFAIDTDWVDELWRFSVRAVLVVIVIIMRQRR